MKLRGKRSISIKVSNQFYELMLENDVYLVCGILIVFLITLLSSDSYTDINVELILIVLEGNEKDSQKTDRVY